MLQHPESTAATGSIQAVKRHVSRLTAGLAEAKMILRMATRHLTLLLQPDGAASCLNCLEGFLQGIVWFIDFSC